MSDKVTFDSNMMNLNFEPPHLKQAEQRLTNLFQSDKKTILFVSVGNTLDESIRHYQANNAELAELKANGS